VSMGIPCQPMLPSVYSTVMYNIVSAVSLITIVDNAKEICKFMMVDVTYVRYKIALPVQEITHAQLVMKATN